MNLKETKRIHSNSMGTDIVRIEDHTHKTIWKEQELVKYYYQIGSNQAVLCSEQYVGYGEDGTPPSLPTTIQFQTDTYYIDQWTPAPTQITCDGNFLMKYVKRYSVNFLSNGTYVISSIVCEPGTKVEYVQPPSYEYQTFISADPQEIQHIEGSQNVIYWYGNNIISIRKIQNSYYYDGYPHEFIVSAEYSFHGTAEVLYSIDGQTWSTERITRTDIGVLTVYYKITHDNYRTLQGESLFSISQKPSYSVKFCYIDENQQDRTQEQYVEEGSNAIPPQRSEYDSRPSHDFIKWDNDYNNITEDTVISAVYELKTLSCHVFSQRSIVHDIKQVKYGHKLIPVASCDEIPSDRWMFKRWYRTQDGQSITVLSDDLEWFISPNLSIWPEYERWYYLSAFTVSSDGIPYVLSVFDVLSGKDFLSDHIELPSVEHHRIKGWNPEYGTWNPILDDTSICCMYEKIEYIPIISGGEGGTPGQCEGYTISKDEQRKKITTLPTREYHYITDWRAEGYYGTEVEPSVDSDNNVIIPPGCYGNFTMIPSWGRHVYRLSATVGEKPSDKSVQALVSCDVGPSQGEDSLVSAYYGSHAVWSAKYNGNEVRFNNWDGDAQLSNDHLYNDFVSADQRHTANFLGKIQAKFDYFSSQPYLDIYVTYPLGNYKAYYRTNDTQQWTYGGRYRHNGSKNNNVSVYFKVEADGYETLYKSAEMCCEWYSGNIKKETYTFNWWTQKHTITDPYDENALSIDNYKDYALCPDAKTEICFGDEKFSLYNNLTIGYITFHEIGDNKDLYVTGIRKEERITMDAHYNQLGKRYHVTELGIK